MNLSIAQIAQACQGTLVGKGDLERNVSNVVLDSRQVEEGGVFLATVGERVDGHKFIPDVFAKGVALVITQKTPTQLKEEYGIAEEAWGDYVLVEDSFQALKDIAESYRENLQIPIVGITGSVGKTSTKEFIAGVLAEKYKVLKTEGNFNNEVGLPLTLLRIREEHEVAVVEMGISDFGEMHRLSKMAKPNICVMTNIGQCHLENLKTRDGILKAKSEIFDFMAPDGQICLNGDDDKLQTVAEVKGKKPHFFGLGENPAEEVYATNVVSKGLWGSEATLVLRDGEATSEVQVEVPLPGIHMVTNAAAAACVAKQLGLTTAQMAEGIRKVSALGGRNNLIRVENYTLIDDCYNANPVSMGAALDLLQMADTLKVAVLGDMFELGENSDAMHAQVGRHAAVNGTDHIICIGENSQHMYQAARKVAAPNQQIWHFATKADFFAELEADREALLPKGATILIKASHGMGFAEIVENLRQY